ncbi:MAG TPA: HesA/MoeB/ThiF family protein [Bacteroidia bacterium]|jgi:adenylyltransferase/sulfurtransferase|nr:HesA/MoeB/ThiF family protein [Bacteroidia bacterium]
MSNFSKDELVRYSRQLMLPGMGLKGQEKFKNAKVLVIGAGGLGCPVLQYLSAAGIGTIGIVDFDTIELHNLHRQILYNASDVGKSKARVATERLTAQNPHLLIREHAVMLSAENAVELIQLYDLVIDGSDNFETRYLVNDTCVELNKPLVYGSIFKYEGQAAVFNYKGSKDLRAVYAEAPDPEDVPNCSETGVIGAVPGVIGTLMCTMAFEIIQEKFCNANTLHIFDFKEYSLQKLIF